MVNKIWVIHKKRRLEEYDTYRTYQRQEKQRRTTSNLHGNLNKQIEEPIQQRLAAKVEVLLKTTKEAAYSEESQHIQ